MERIQDRSGLLLEIQVHQAALAEAPGIGDGDEEPHRALHGKHTHRAVGGKEAREGRLGVRCERPTVVLEQLPGQRLELGGIGVDPDPHAPLRRGALSLLPTVPDPVVGQELRQQASSIRCRISRWTPRGNVGV